MTERATRSACRMKPRKTVGSGRDLGRRLKTLKISLAEPAGSGTGTVPERETHAQRKRKSSVKNIPGERMERVSSDVDKHTTDLIVDQIHGSQPSFVSW